MVGGGELLIIHLEENRNYLLLDNIGKFKYLSDQCIQRSGRELCNSYVLFRNVLIND